MRGLFRTAMKSNLRIAEDATSHFEIVPKRARAAAESLHRRFFRRPSAGERRRAIAATGKGGPLAGGENPGPDPITVAIERATDAVDGSYVDADAQDHVYHGSATLLAARYQLIRGGPWRYRNA